MSHLVSAVITTHNRLNLLLQAIESVKRQTYKNMECIVVDDASSDETQKEMQKLADKGEIRYIRIDKEQSRGGNHARNQGILAAKGKYIAFLDDDDEWLECKIEKQVQALEKKTDCRFCYCGLIKNYNNGQKIVPDKVENMREGDLSKRILIGVLCTTSSMMVDRQLLLEVGLFDEQLSFWQEYELSIRLCMKTKVAAVKENLVLYRINISDKQRLTNKLEGWEQAVHYVSDKYEKQLSTLSAEELHERRMLINLDALWRCFYSGNKKAQRKYLKERFLLTHGKRDFLRFICNRGMHL